MAQNYNHFSRHRQPKRIPNLVVFFLLISIGIIIYSLRHNNSRIISPLSDSNRPFLQKLSDVITQKKDPAELSKIIKKSIGNTWNNYSVYIKDLNSDFECGVDESMIYTAASVNKVPILADLYFEAQKGTVNLDKVITLQPEDIQDYGTGTIRYDTPGTTYTVQTLARLMMEKSDNTAAFIIARSVLSMESIQNNIETWGLKQTDLENNKTSNKDMAILFEKIYQEKIANHALTAEMLDFLKNSDFEDRIPALLPKNITVYHKTGNGIGFVHDVGIVKSAKKIYYIGIMTGNINDDVEATKTAALISKEVYDFMN
jgi:beta-lactamase class A